MRIPTPIRNAGRLLRAFWTEDLSFTTSASFLEDRLSAGKSATGIGVSERTAMRYSAVSSCVRILAETVAMIPLVTYRRRRDGGKEKATAHRLYETLHLLPNQHMSSFTWRESSVAHQALWGNAYSWINQAGSVTELIPLLPDRTRLSDDGKKYTTLVDGVLYDILPEQVLHVPSLAMDGRRGLSPIQYMRESIGLGLAGEEFFARFFSNDARPGGVLEVVGRFEGADDPRYKRLKADWEAMHGGLSNKHKVAILEEGTKFHEIGVPPADAQFLDTRKFQIAEICRWYRIPAHMVGDLDRATFSNIEQMSLDFVIYSMMPWFVRWEQAMNIRLLTPKERAHGDFIEFNINGLLRGDSAARSAFYHQMLMDGVFCADQVLELENMNPQPDGQGKLYFVAANMISKDSILNPPAAAADPPGPGTEGRKGSDQVLVARRRISGRYATRISADTAKILELEERLILDQISLTGDDLVLLRGWIPSFYSQFRQDLPVAFSPDVSALTEEISKLVLEETGSDPKTDGDLFCLVNSYLSNMAFRYSSRSRSDIEALLRALEARVKAGETVNVRAEFKDLFATWNAVRPAEAGRNEATAIRNLTAKTVYSKIGVKKIRSVMESGSCPYCGSLHGVSIPINGYFLTKNQEWKPEGAPEAITIGTNISHPPYHGGCDCDIIADR